MLHIDSQPSITFPPILNYHRSALLGLLFILLTALSGCSPQSLEHAPPPQSSATPGPIERESKYLTMRDGTRIAIDVYLPTNRAPNQTLPTILHQTRYWRAVEYRWLISLFKEDRPRGITGMYAHRFLQQGYAWVDVDVRGTGASFGSRPVAYSPAEIRDGAEIVDWIIDQPWSNGQVGAMGLSYSGGTAEMLLINQHPAVKAVAPMFSGYDLYSEIAFPGGIHLTWFTKTWSAINNHLDHNELPFAGWIANLFVRGVRPVDADINDRLLSLALQEHEVNWSPYNEASGVTFRDDVPPSRQAANIDALSPQTYADVIAQSGAAIFSYSGWFDGGYQLAAIKRHLRHQQNPANKLLLGPWDHGGKRRISPTQLGPVQYDHAGELIRFFDQHLKDHNKRLVVEPPIRYYTMGEERWKSTKQWPPESTLRPMYFHEGGSLSGALPPVSPHQSDEYQVNPNTGTGDQSRWNTLVGIPLRHPYPDRKERDKELQVYTSSPLKNDLEVTGHPVATIYLSANSPDTTVFVYLEDVTPEGDVHYITEGELRALHRRWSRPNGELPNTLPVPTPTFRQADGAPLPPGKVVPLTITLLPTSYQFKQGHRIRVALAGADKDHFQLLDDPSPTWQIWHTSDHPSHIDLPVID